MAAARLSVVLPVLNEAAGLGDALHALAPLRARGAELIVADGGSSDRSAALATAGGAQLVHAPRGRALQMNAGAAQASGDVLLFLHADTVLPDGADALISEALAGGSRVWGRFDVAITGRPPMLKLIAALMNLRSRLTGIATGDQAMFMTRAAFEAVGGFPAQPLMEDIEMSRRLLKLSRPACLNAKVQTSGRRWESRGVWRTVLLMWRLRFAYWRGAAPERLADLYR
ncbi:MULTISPECIES: TIGR04283 family arsenosugar biosynthesis glycosyltransferase [unclassified Polaromonas]|jgi:rSAM/selenodomain-associated transferase 2|uniref:TIGR04283 family arsenosugar biosynthesis glycosyltransferase n=1 Tax=unclassified Polaromonas TaxID=2638319 RepID=UPI000BD8DE3A|nr:MULTISPECIES: TIGR04283 family arsenosugar biosynthesis glycosyltransferase [unclassified Polaromonas]OYY32865.1 MAG: glycosyl transferase [Polaromonas sp. 35-63-35]OYZ16276.1 MAG: glycosyl transferase [Polaromonas sp. 16-63-31]OYZ76324.1 MAG: glycosyl transferase [Polaromonas sp. 24-63-21]OZA51168.1 MAG: glycosyl transferase [Polaromonas sp. 17-63-33]OZA86506.1 MAG: glycosyl transferase [Polaromonas sp. 39-63-25]